MPEHDCGCDRRLAGAQRHDLALAGLGERRRGAADEARIASSWISAVPRLPFQPLASSRRNVSSAAATSSRVRATSKRDSAMLGQPVALAAQFLQFLGAERVAQQFVGIARGVEAGAEMGLQHARTQAVPPQRLAEGLHGGAVERHVAQDQRVRAGVPRLPQQSRRGVVRRIAIEQRRAQRAIGVGADQSGQGNPVGAPHRNDRHQADQPAAPSGAASLRAISADAPVRPLAEAFTAISQPADNSRSVRSRVRQGRAIGSAGPPSAGEGPRHRRAMRDRPRLCQQSRPRPRFPVREGPCAGALHALPGNASAKIGKHRWRRRAI